MKKIIVAIGLSLVSFGSLFSQTKIYNLPSNIGSTWDWLPTTQGVNTVKINPTNLWLGIPFAIKDEGINVVGSGATSINFTGAGVTTTQVSNAVTVNIPSSGGGASAVTTPTTTATTGTINLIFDSDKNYIPFAQTGNITLSTSGSPIEGKTIVLTVDGNSSSTLAYPNIWVVGNGVFNNTKRNRLYIQYTQGEYVLNIINPLATPAADVIAPTLISATVENGNTSAIILTYSEALATSPLPATTDFTLNLSKTVTAVSIAGSVVTLTVNSPYSTGNAPTVSYTSGTNKIKDLASTPNNAASFTNQTVTNNIGGDITPPTYSVQTVTGLATAAATFNAQINEAGTVKYMLTTSASAPTKSAILAGTGAVGSNFGSLVMVANTTNSASLTSLTASTSYYLWSYSFDVVNNETTIQSAINFTTLGTGATDNFNRTNSATSLGAATTGQAYTIPTSGSVFGISSNTAYLSTLAATNIAYLDAGVSNCTVNTDIVVASNTSNNSYRTDGIVFRYTDASNYWILQESWRPGFDGTKTITLNKIVAGVSSAVGAAANLTASAFTISLKVVLSGSSISYYAENGLIATVTDAFNSSATKHGLYAVGTSGLPASPTFDNFIAQ